MVPVGGVFLVGQESRSLEWEVVLARQNIRRRFLTVCFCCGFGLRNLLSLLYFHYLYG